MLNTVNTKVLLRTAQRFFFSVICVMGLVALAHAKEVEVPTSDDDVRPILIGQKIPKIKLKNPAGEVVKLNSLLKEKPTLLVFYRGGWCPYCNLHLAELRKVEAPLNDLGFQIIAVSPDKPEELQKTGEKNELGYTLLSDSDAEAIKALGLAYKVGTTMRVAMKTFGVNLEKSSGQDHHLLPVPAALLVDTKGMVTFTFVSPNYKVRVDNDVIMAAAKAQLKAKK